MPLLKRVAAQTGQRVRRTGLAITVDGVPMGDALDRDRRGRSLFCQQRAPTVLSPRDADRFRNWLFDLLAALMPPPLTERDYDWHAIAHACDVDHADLQRAGSVLAPGLDALRRELARRGHVTVKRSAARRTPPSSERGTLHRGADQQEAVPRRRGPRAKLIVEFPESDGRPWTVPPSFADALDLHMRRHGDRAKHLAHALEASAAQVDATALNMRRPGVKVPRASQSLAALPSAARLLPIEAAEWRLLHISGDHCRHQSRGETTTRLAPAA